MPKRDRWRRFLERILPWFDPAEYDREQAAAAHAIVRSRRAVVRTNRVLARVRRDEPVLYAYRQYEDVVRR